ncbi:MAG: hypothetical protein NZM04_09710 [Methylacidiphilales bacterium]|nr:hypothetical protein [Candidatus Methylacidiphilales bacterium]
MGELQGSLRLLCNAGIGGIPPKQAHPGYQSYPQEDISVLVYTLDIILAAFYIWYNKNKRGDGGNGRRG